VYVHRGDVTLRVCVHRGDVMLRVCVHRGDVMLRVYVHRGVAVMSAVAPVVLVRAGRYLGFVMFVCLLGGLI